MLEALKEIILPVVATLITILVPVAIAALFKLMSKWGLDIEASHRDALQSALHNAAMLAISKAGAKAFASGINARNLVTNDALHYLNNSVPDAIKAFGLSESQMAELMTPHIAAAAVAMSENYTPSQPQQNMSH